MSKELNISNVLEFFKGKNAATFLPVLNDRELGVWSERYKIDFDKVDKVIRECGEIEGDESVRILKSVLCYLAYEYYFSVFIKTQLHESKKGFNKELGKLKKVLESDLSKISFVSGSGSVVVKNEVLLDYLLRYINIKEFTDRVESIESNRELWPEIENIQSYFKQYTMGVLFSFSKYLEFEKLFNRIEKRIEFVVSICNCFMDEWPVGEPIEYLTQTFNKVK